MKTEGQQEKVLMNLYRSRKAFLVEYFCGGILLLLLGTALAKGIQLSLPLKVLPPVIAGFAVISAEVSRLLHRSTITSSKIVIVDGLIKVRKRHVFISSINDVDTKQSRMQRLFRFGNVHIRTASGEDLEIKDINNPEKVMEKLEHYLAPES